MAFVPKDWRNATTYAGGGDTSTPVTAESLEDLETRVTDYAVDLVGAFNVKDYGALGDNSNDDTAEIQSAITAATTSGGEVIFPPGIYRLSSALSIPNFVSLRGSGADATILRCTGNHFAINFNPANRTSVSGLMIDALSTQSSGGGFNFANAVNNIRIDDVYLGSNLYYGLDISPTSGAGIYQISRVRWNGIEDSNTAIRIGGGGALVTDIFFTHCIGTASTQGDMAAAWISIPANADTVHFTDCLFYRGTVGAKVGTSTSVTNIKFLDTTIDQMSAEGMQTGAVTEMSVTGCTFSTCGAANVPQLDVGVYGTTEGFRFVNCVVQNGGGYGAILRVGSVHNIFADSIFADNNTSNTAFNDGLAVATNATEFHIVNCVSGNGVFYGTGHQKYGISVGAGTSNYYVITGNRLKGNDTSNAVSDGGSGVNKVVSGNI